MLGLCIWPVDLMGLSEQAVHGTHREAHPQLKQLWLLSRVARSADLGATHSILCPLE